MGYRLPFGPVAVLLENAYWPVLTIVLPPVFLLFPDGALPSPRWRWVLRSYLAVGGALVAPVHRRYHRHRHQRHPHDASGGLPASITHPAARPGC